MRSNHRLIAILLVLAMLIGFVPGSVWTMQANAATESESVSTENTGVSQVSSDRTTIYISSSGSELYSGTSASWPKKDVTKIPTYLAKGYNVLLKRGDIWYLPYKSLSLKNIEGTEDSPVILGSYGDAADPKPVIAYMKKIENSAWTLVDAENNIYSTDVSNMTARSDTDIRVHRLFVNDAAYLHQSYTDYTQLAAEQFCDYGGTLYVRTNGGVPTNVEVTPYAGVGKRLMITDTAYLTIENIHFKGASALNPVIQLDAPTSHVKLQYLDITHCFYYILQLITLDDSSEVNYKPEISHCYIDACFSEAEGAHNGDHWSVSITEGITMRDAVDGAWIHHNTIRNMSHAFIAIESLDNSIRQNTTGVRNCIIEDNVLEAANAKYARAFNIGGGPNLAGVEMCRNNTFRRNKCYDMTTSSHLFGENNLIYSNLFSYVHCYYKEDGSLFDGKGAQPWGFDSAAYNDNTSIGNMIINNTFYDMSGAASLNDSAYPEKRVYDNLYANNLIINYNSESTVYPGGFNDHTTGINYVMNNGVYAAGRSDDYFVDGTAYAGEAVNQVIGYSGNMSGDPKFATADMSITGLFQRQEFDLSSDSPYCYAGLALNAEIYDKFPMYAVMLADYTDINGKPYDPETPSVGAYSYGALEEKTDITEVVTQIPAVSIVTDYKEYWGEKWQEALGNETVAVKTSDGKTVAAAVEWDYAPLGDLSVVGKYTVTGKLVSESYNTNNITVARTIYIHEKTGNLMHNGTFDTNYSSWYCGQNPVVENGILQLTLKSNSAHQWNVMYSYGYSSSSASSNNAKKLADAVAAVGGGQYYLGFDSKWVTVAQEASEMGIYLQLHGYDVYNQSTNNSHMKGEVKINHKAENSGSWNTVYNIVNLDGTDAYLRASVIFYNNEAKHQGQVVQLDNLMLVPLKINLDMPSNLEEPVFSSVTSAKSGTNTAFTFKTVGSYFGSYFTNPYVVVNYKGNTYKITEYTTNSQGEYVFTFDGVASYPMDAAVTATLCYTYDDNKVLGSEPYTYYAKDYCKDNGHSYEIMKSEAPTCAQTGSVTYKCPVCGDSYTEQLPATGVHTYDNDADTDCNVCGAVRELEAITGIVDWDENTVIAIVSGYNKYVTDWQAGLALPTEVTVTTSAGRTVRASVTWGYSPLGDLSTVGKYVLTGQLSAEDLINPEGLAVKQIIVIREKTNLVYNGDFTEKTNAYGAPGWSLNWTRYIMADPDNADNNIIRFSRNGTTTSSQILFPNADGIPKLSSGIRAAGVGQYYMQFDAKAVEYVNGDTTVPAREDIQLWPIMMAATAENATSGFSALKNATGAAGTLTTEWQTIGHQFDIAELSGSYRLDIKGKVPTAPAYLYMDNIEVFALKTTLTMADICDHSYTSEVTTAPTCTTAGVKTFTCSDCGDTYTEEIAAMGHKESEAVKENEIAATCTAAGLYDKVVYCATCKAEISREMVVTEATGHAYDNDQDADCNNCGKIREVGPATDANLKFNAAPGLSFKDYIGMQILVTNAVAQNYDRVWIEAVQADPAGDVTTILEGVPYFYNIYLKFEQQVLSWSMAENITLTLWAEKDGETVKGETFSGSVEDLALAKIAEYAAANNTAAVTALVDMLNYGAAVQTSFNHNADMLPNTKLGDYTGTTATPEFNATNSITGTGTLAVASNSISMQAKVEIQLLIMGSISDYTVNATVGGAAAPVVVDTEKYAAYNWTLVKVAVAADKMRQTYTISVNDANGTPVTPVYNVSVEAYGKTQLEGAKADVVIAMMRYGDSVAAL